MLILTTSSSYYRKIRYIERMRSISVIALQRPVKRFIHKGLSEAPINTRPRALELVHPTINKTISDRNRSTVFITPKLNTSLSRENKVTGFLRLDAVDLLVSKHPRVYYPYKQDATTSYHYDHSYWERD